MRFAIAPAAKNTGITCSAHVASLSSGIALQEVVDTYRAAVPHDDGHQHVAEHDDDQAPRAEQVHHPVAARWRVTGGAARRAHDGDSGEHVAPVPSHAVHARPHGSCRQGPNVPRTARRYAHVMADATGDGVRVAGAEAGGRPCGAARARCGHRHDRRVADRRRRRARGRGDPVAALQLPVPQRGQERARPPEGARGCDPRGGGGAGAAGEAAAGAARPRWTVDGWSLLLDGRRRGRRPGARARAPVARLPAARGRQARAATGRALPAPACAGAVRERHA